MLDKMSLSEALNLNTKTMLIEGFVDAGTYTTEKLKSEPVKYALASMYRPLRGDWYQVCGKKLKILIHSLNILLFVIFLKIGYSSISHT